MRTLRGAGLRSAFTTVELLIVIGTLVLLMALAVPAFNYIMGNRSTQAAENIVSAMLGRARGYAIANQCNAGVAFFFNPATERTTLALVVQKMPGGYGVEDSYPNYKGWADVPTGSPNPTHYNSGDAVIAPIADTTPTGEGKVLVRNYYAKVTHDSMPASVPPTFGFWGTGMTADGYVDLVTDTDLEALPPGVGCQLVNSPNHPTLVPDRYVRTGAIMFDQQGTLLFTALQIPQGSQLAALVENQPDPTQQTNLPANGVVCAQRLFTSQLGVAIYGREEFRGQGFDERIPDTCLSPSLGPVAAAAGPGQPQEEDWLAQNAQILMVSRYNGTLIKGE